MHAPCPMHVHGADITAVLYISGVVALQFRLGSIQVTSLAQTDRQAVYCRMFDSLLSVSEECRDRAEQCNKQSEEERKISKSALQVTG